jgi:hypothetical protein
VKFERVKNFTEVQFRRIMGIKKKTFDKMVEILINAEEIKKFINI